MNCNIIRGLAVSALLIVAPLSTANAADAPGSTWTGVYFGGTVGYGWGKSQQYDPLGNATAPYSMQGVVGGPELGFNWQYNRLVLGLEADFSWSGINGGGITTPTWGCGGVIGAPTPACTTAVQWFATQRGRAGYLVTDSLLAYGTGGGAEASVENSIPGCPAPGFCGFITTAKTRTGWTAGGGLEYRFTQWMSLKAEYLHVNIGQYQWTTFLAGTDPGLSYAHFDVVRVGLNYKFW